MSKNSTTPLKHTSDPTHENISKEEHIALHGGDVEAAGYKKEKPQTVTIGNNEANLLFESITNPSVFTSEKILEARQKDQKLKNQRENKKQDLKVKTIKNERIQKYEDSGLYNEEELNIIKQEILSTPFVIPEISQEQFTEFKKAEVFNKIFKPSDIMLTGANFETVDILSKFLKYDDLYENNIEEEFKGVISGVNKGDIKYDEFEGIIRIRGNTLYPNLNPDLVQSASIGSEVYIDKATGELIDKSSLTRKQIMMLDSEKEIFEAIEKGKELNPDIFYSTTLDAEGNEIIEGYNYFAEDQKQILSLQEYEDLFEDWVKATDPEIDLEEISIEENLKLRKNFNAQGGFIDGETYMRIYNQKVFKKQYQKNGVMDFGTDSETDIVGNLRQITQAYQNLAPNIQTYILDRPSLQTWKNDYSVIYSPLTNQGAFLKNISKEIDFVGDYIYRLDQNVFLPNKEVVSSVEQFDEFIENYNALSNDYRGDLTLLNNAFDLDEMRSLRKGLSTLSNLEGIGSPIETTFNDQLEGSGYTIKVIPKNGTVTFELMKEGQTVFSSTANGVKSPDTEVLKYIVDNITSQELTAITKKQIVDPIKEIQQEKKERFESNVKDLTEKEVVNDYFENLFIPTITVSRDRYNLTTENKEAGVINYIKNQIASDNEINKDEIRVLVKSYNKLQNFSGTNYQYNSFIDGITNKYYEFGILTKDQYNKNKQQSRINLADKKSKTWAKKTAEENGYSQTFDYSTNKHIINIDGEEQVVSGNTYRKYQDLIVKENTKEVSNFFSEKDGFVDLSKKAAENGYSLVFEQNGRLLKNTDEDFNDLFEPGMPFKFIRAEWEREGDETESFSLIELGEDKDGNIIYLNDKIQELETNHETIINELQESFLDYRNNVYDSFEASDLLDISLSQKGIERDYSTIWSERFGNGVDGVFYSIPALFGNEFAQNILDRNEADAKTQRQFKWGEDAWYQNVGLVFADQGANMLFFIGTMGTGSYFNLARTTSMYVASGGVGLQEGGRTHTRLLNNKKNASIARQQIKELQVSLDKGIISENYFDKRVELLNEVVALGDLESWQHWGTVGSSIVFEAGFTALFGRMGIGRVSTADRFVNAFVNAGASRNVANYSGVKQIWNSALTMAKSAGGEVIEEEAIYISTQLSDALFTGTEVDLSQINKVAIDAAIMSGGTNALSLTYDGFMNHGTRKKLAEDIAFESTKIKNYSDDIKELQKNTKISKKDRDEQIKNLETLRLDAINKRSMLIGEAEIEVLGLDEESQLAILQNFSTLYNLHEQAGIYQKENLSEASIKARIDFHVQKLNKEEAGSGDAWLENYETQKNKVEEISENYNEETAINALYGGDVQKRNKVIDRIKRNKSWSSKYEKANSKQRLKLEMNFMYEENLRTNANAVKNDANIKEQVEQEVFSERDETGKITERLNQEQWKQKNNKKRISSSQKQELDTWYNQVARTRISTNTGRDITTFEEGQINAENIIKKVKEDTGKDLVIVYDDNVETLIEKYIFPKGGAGPTIGGMSAQEKADVINALKDGNGAIVGNKFLTVNPNARAQLNSKDALNRNKAFIGAVWLHETGHYLDNSTKSRSELNEKAFLLSKGLTEKGGVVSIINEQALSILNQKGIKVDGKAVTNVGQVYNRLKTEKDQQIINEINTFLDEYIRETEFTLQSRENDFIYTKLLNEGRRFNKIRSWKGDYTIRSGRDAIFEVVSYIQAFRKGELSAAYKSQLERAGGRTDLVGDESKIQKSSQVEINKLVRNENREVVTKEQYDRVNVNDAAMLLTPENESLNGLIVDLGFKIEGNNVYGFSKNEFIQTVKDQLSTAVINYNPETLYKNVAQGDLSGWLALHIILKKPGVLEDFKKRREVIDAAGKPVEDPDRIETQEGTVVFAKRLGFEENVVRKDENDQDITRNEFDLIIEGAFDEIIKANPKSYKDVKDLVKGGILVQVLNKVAEEFGVSPNKLINDTSLTVTERRSIQTKIRSLTARTLLNALPEGFNNVAESTGLPNVLLNAKNPETGEPNLLYTKQEQRAKTGVKQRVGRRFIFPPKKKDKGGAGPFLQVMNFVDNINESHFLNLFGITPVGVESKFRTEDRSVDSPLRAIVVQVAALVANQSTRKIANERGLFGLETIASGKADVQYSKAIALSNIQQLISDYDNGRELFIQSLNLLGVGKIARNVKQFKSLFNRALNIAYSNVKWDYVVDGKSVNYRTKLYNEYNKYRKDFVERYLPYEKNLDLESKYDLLDYLTLASMQDTDLIISQIFNIEEGITTWVENEINRENQRSYNRALIPDYIKLLNKRGGFNKQIISSAKKLNVTPAELQALIQFSFLKNGFEAGFDKDSKGKYRGSQSIFKNKSFYFENFLKLIAPNLESIVRKKTTLQITIDGKTEEIQKPEHYNYINKQKTEKQHLLSFTEKQIEDHVSGKSKIKLPKELIKEMQLREQLAEEAIQFTDDIYAIGANIAKDPNSDYNKYNFAVLIDQFNKDMKTPLRIGAPAMWLALNPPTMSLNDENGKRNFEWEHGGPAAKINIMFIEKHWKGGDVSLDNIKKTFQVGVLHRDFNDNVGRFFKRSMNFDYEIGDSPVGRWNNSLLLGGPAHLLFNWKTGEIAGQNHVNYYKLTDNYNKGMQQSKAVKNSRLIDKNTKSRGMSAFDFDETLIDKGENTIIATKGDDVVKISSRNWPIDGPRYTKEGYEFDFSDFINVKGGVEGPLMQKFRNRIAKYGIENNYILTARPADSAPAIQAWLKTQGINMPIENITGLGNSTGEAKAMWIAGKFSEGYNDIYFVDDALPNVEAVKNMMQQLDIKGSSVQAKIQFSKNLNDEFNIILEKTTGIDAQKRFSNAQAKLRGKGFKFTGLIPSSAQDFQGLIYSFLPTGKEGEEAMKFFKKSLIDPFARGVNELNTSRQKSAEDYQNLLKKYPNVRKDLKKSLSDFEGLDSEFTVDQAIRVYLWDKSGFEVPGLSQRDLKMLTDFVKEDSELMAFADAVGLISKKDRGYAEPGEHWLVENINSDLMSDGAIGEVRSEFLAEFINNKNEIFSPENLNKIEAAYGAKFREALEDILFRMETGRNMPRGGGRLMQEYTSWVNGSVGAIMFFNMRSALLQTISAVNYINWSDNNPLKAAAAFANQKQYWSDFVFLFNSDFLKQRRAGNRRGVNEQELSQAVAGKSAYEQSKAAIRYLLKIGFLPTQIADSFAIASGGATFYRNRVKSYLKQGLSKAEAEERAFLDFQETTEVSQQSARPDLISQQQANPLGRLILAFANTPMQYGRIIDKAFRDIVNNRGDFKTNTSKIIYYGFIQSIIFSSLQTALFAVIGSEDEEKEEMLSTKTDRILNNTLDTFLTTFGYGGKAISTAKNTAMEYLKQRDKDLDDNFMTRSDHAYTLLQALSFSPPIGSKARKIYSSIQTEKFNRELMKQRGLTLDNPVWQALGNVIEGVTNIPLGRLSNKMLNIDNALDSRNETWQRLALITGWNTWDLGIRDHDLVALGENIRETKRQEKEMEKEKKKIEKQREKLREKYPGKTDEQIDKAVLIEEKTKQIFDLNKREQVQIIEGLDLDAKKYPKEKDRVDIILEYYNKDNVKMDSTLNAIENYIPTEKEQRSIDLFKMNKKDQINMLMDLGLSSRRIKKLKYEEDRVKMIMQLESKKK